MPNPKRTIEVRLLVIVTINLEDPELAALLKASINQRSSVAALVADEIASNLESVSYIDYAAANPLLDSKEELMTVKFVLNDKGSPAGKLADAELHFSGGPLDGLKLIGFAVWERKGGARNITVPARQYSVNGERRSYALLRPVVDQACQDRLRDLMLEAFKEHEAQIREST